MDEKYYMFVIKKYEEKLRELMSEADFEKFVVSVAQADFEQEVKNMTESDFKDFCLENMDMIFGEEDTDA